MRGTLFWSAVWIGIIAAGYLVIDHFTTPPPVARSMTQGVREISIPVSRDGHFYIDGSINGVPIKFMIDTGATYVSVDDAFARRARLPEGITGYFSTANGMAEGRIVKDQSVDADAFQVTNLSIAVMPAKSRVGLLGQNFLRRFEVSQDAKQMRLSLPAPEGR